MFVGTLEAQPNNEEALIITLGAVLNIHGEEPWDISTVATKFMEESSSNEKKSGFPFNIHCKVSESSLGRPQFFNPVASHAQPQSKSKGKVVGKL